MDDFFLRLNYSIEIMSIVLRLKTFLIFFKLSFCPFFFFFPLFGIFFWHYKKLFKFFFFVMTGDSVGQFLLFLSGLTLQNKVSVPHVLQEILLFYEHPKVWEPLAHSRTLRIQAAVK